MPDLLTARDIESKYFSRAMRGYAVSEVDEFLDRVAEDIQEYSLRCAELERRIDRLEEQIREYENLKETLQGTLLMAQKSAEAKEEAASRQAETLISEARLKAEQVVLDASAAKDRERRELQRLRQMKQEFKAEFRALLSRFAALSDGEEESFAEEEESAR
ncbi:cell division initiation protein [Aminivibrio pyruvatiphilus]|uniref:Cell division initiation protein n=1 Tax=Aminivibrio pyruvatiphilus TaxID=1005740 RepID=A0A4R8MHV2_9BACT|nr:DivIVA domain-containing protein [Aminivibrio pyruvatiphilus]TDY65204.1 cell division initiation protein [Aminivibrio pyruvatiphilus]